MFADFILNGAGHGAVGEGLFATSHGQMRFDTGLLRPYVNDHNVPVCDVQTGRMVFNQAKNRMEPEIQQTAIADLRRRGLDHPTWNAASLQKDAYVQIDTVVLRAARQRLRAWADLAAANSFGGFNGMAKMTLEYEASSDPGEALVDMDGIVDGRTDSPLFKMRSTPLPITHSDFWFSSRRLAVSRNTGTPLDTSMAEAAGRRVAEMVEKTTIGVEAGVQGSTLDSRYDGTNKVYGYTTYPGRLTKSDLTTPTGSNPEAIMTDVLEMREQLYAQNFFGPFMMYYTPSYDIAFDNDYFRSGSTAQTRTLRERIMSIDGISGMRRLDYFTGATYQIILVQMTADVARAIIGMPITTVQWESQGGMRQNWKVMCIHVPQIRSDYADQCGVLHGTAA